MFRRILSLLNGTERQKAAMLFVGILTNSVVEILGLAVIIPVIGLIVEPDIIESNPNFYRAYEFCQHWGVNTYNDFLLVLCVGLILAFAFKALYGIGINPIQVFIFGGAQNVRSNVGISLLAKLGKASIFRVRKNPYRNQRLAHPFRSSIHDRRTGHHQ